MNFRVDDIASLYTKKSVYVWSWFSAELCLTLATPWTVAHQAPLCIGFFRQEYWSGFSFPSKGDLSARD